MLTELLKLPPKFLAVAEELNKRIEFESINEKGANGYVLIGTNRITDRKVVVKFYYWGDGAHAEPRLLADLASEHVLQIHDAAAVDDEDAYFMAPYCENGDLDDVMQASSIGNVRAVDIILDIASGANFIHSKGYLHRDLKPSNVFCDNDKKFVIGDFGSVVKKGADGYAETASKHSLLYRTPEEINSNRAYEQGDVYQLGVILYQLLGGYLPYNETDWLTAKQLALYQTMPHPENQLFAASIIEKKIKDGNLLNLSSLPAWCPSELKAVIRKCCRVNHADRFEGVSAMMVKLNNIRASLPDWRCDPDPILYRHRARFRITESGGTYGIEKKLDTATNWRRQRKIEPCTSMQEAVERAESLT